MTRQQFNQAFAHAFRTLGEFEAKEGGKFTVKNGVANYRSVTYYLPDGAFSHTFELSKEQFADFLNKEVL